MRRINKRRLALASVALAAVFMLPQTASADNKSPNPQDPSSGNSTDAPVPDQCVLMRQLNPGEQKYRLTYNAPFTYTLAAVGPNFFNLKCGFLQFTVPRGQDSMVDFTGSAELDCQAPNSPAPNNGWCESRFLVNMVNVLPNNGGRGDTFAYDSSNGGSFDWQANTNDQVGHAFCPRSEVTQNPCVYNVYHQARLNNGANSLWVDDSTVRVDVSEGPVTVMFLVP